MNSEELECKIEFIVETLARLAVNDEKHDLRLSRLERIVKLMVRAGRRERQLRREQNARFDEQFAMVNGTLAGINVALAELTQAQKRTDRKLDALVDIVRQQQNGGASLSPQ